MIFFFPIKVDVQSVCIPVMNQLLVGLCILCFGTILPIYELSVDDMLERVDELRDGVSVAYVFHPMVLNGWDIPGLVGHAFLHEDILHLLGNMIFMWIFGNAICARVGNLIYIPIFLTLTLAAAVGHNLLSGGPAVGASGVVNGLIGMFVVWFPAEYMTCVVVFGFTPRLFEIKAYWMIALWVVLDLLGVMSGESGIAYWAHLGGFGGGFLLATALLKLELIDMDNQVTLFDLRGLR